MEKFTGFPPEGPQFLFELGMNNNREWFTQRRSLYKQAIEQPAQNFIVELGQRLEKRVPSIQYDTRLGGRGSLTRIQRDVRFASDKSPYKTHIGIDFWQGAGSRMERPGLFVSIDADGAQIYMGLYVFSREVRTAYRRAVEDAVRGDQLLQIVADLEDSKYLINAPHFVRIPADYAIPEERKRLFLQNGLYACWDHVSAEILTTPDFIDICEQHFNAMLPLHQWLCTTIGVDASPDHYPAQRAELAPEHG